MRSICVGLDALYRDEIAGIDGDIRERIHLLYTARWTYFHTNVFTAAKFLDSEYIKDEFTLEQRGEFETVLRKIAKTPGCKYKFAQFMAEWANLKTALATQSHGLDSDGAFSKVGCDMPSFEWANAYLYKWPGLQWVAMRLTALSCSASGCVPGVSTAGRSKGGYTRESAAD